MKSTLRVIASLITMLLVYSCDRYDIKVTDDKRDYDGWHSAKVNMNVTRVSFDLDASSTRAVDEGWKDGDRIYLILTDKDGGKVQAYVQYSASAGDWGQVEYDGYKSYLTCTTPRKVEAYYFDGSHNATSASVTFTEQTGVYVCTNGTYTYPSDGDLSVSVALAPLTGRIKFAGAANLTASMVGVKTYKGYNRTTGALTESSADVSLKVGSDGYTPYVYGVFVDASSPTLQITTGGEIFQTVFESTTPILKTGKSGYMNLPTADSHRGWKQIVPVTGVVLNKTSLTLDKGKSETLTATVSPTNASDRSVTWKSSDTSVATVDSNGKVTAVKTGSATITVTSAADTSKKATCSVSVIDADANGHQYVDLGLTSGLLWATMNVGASSSSGYGDYYAWGETTTKTTYTSSNYTYTANPMTLPLDKDAAHAKWGGSWRMPTRAEFQELYNECTWTWTTINSKNGYKVTSKKNSNYIFLPAAGYFGPSLNSAGYYGSYWSSSLPTSESSYAYELLFYSGGISPSYNLDRYYGRSVRPVLSK